MKKTITTAELFKLLYDQKGATIAQVLMETKPEMRKRENPYWGTITKRTSVNVMINTSYGNALKKAVAKNLPANLVGKVEVVVQPRTWGDRIGNSCIITHNGVLYVEMRPNSAGKTTYLQGTKRIAATTLASFLPVKKEQAVPVYDVRINNIKEIVLDGTTYTIGA